MNSLAPHDDVLDYLRLLHQQAGKPSARELARKAGDLSHNGINDILMGHRRGRLATSRRIAEILGGDPEMVQRLWDEHGHEPFRPLPTRQVLLEMRDTLKLIQSYVLGELGTEAEERACAEEAGLVAPLPGARPRAVADPEVLAVLEYVARGPSHVDEQHYPTETAANALRRLVAT